MRIRRSLLRLAGGVAVLAATLLLPPVRLRAVALPVMFEALGREVPHPFAPEVEPLDTTLDGIPGRLYSPREGLPPIVIVPGAAPAGIEDPRVNLVARALSRAGREVFIPQLELYREHFTESDFDTIARAIVTLSGRARPSQPVTVLGISYGGSFALVAAADPRVDEKISRIAVLGSYFDLVGLVQAVTTGVSQVEGRTIPWDAHPLAREILYARATELAPEPDRMQLIDALGGKGDPGALSPEVRALYDLLTNRDPSRTFRLAEGLGSEARRFLDRFSPATVARQIDVPVLAMHSTDDPVVPFGELTRLARGMPEAQTVAVSLFRHVDFDASSLRQWFEVLPDLWRLWHFSTWILTV